MIWCFPYCLAGIILSMASANDRRHYIVMPSLIGQAHDQDDPCSVWVEIRNQYSCLRNCDQCPWWYHDTETLSTWVSLCAGNPWWIPCTKYQTCRLFHFFFWLSRTNFWTTAKLPCDTRGVMTLTWRHCYVDMSYKSLVWPSYPPGLRFNIKMSSYQYRKPHCGDKTILRPIYLHNGIPYTGKMISLYWIRAQYSPSVSLVSDTEPINPSGFQALCAPVGAMISSKTKKHMSYVSICSPSFQVQE